ncbi:hypothetical protein A2U01_0068396 [Trifolium medium]|uniref:Uncharacterized protein n=1 Tax=Trifolium medium TaxID=97028 RepID=A0A392SGV1_9FABA|nr:hypothetical protein [Trifolium medium]
MPDVESSKRQSTIVLVHALQNTQLAMGCSRPEVENLTTVPFLVLSSEADSKHSNRSSKPLEHSVQDTRYQATTTV